MTTRDILNTLYHKTPLIFGHRGAQAYAPMNTIPAFQLAAEHGADGIELDVWLTKDGHLAVIHDDTVDGTTDGTGSIQAMTLEEVKALDAGAWFASNYSGTQIPTLDEVFAAVGQQLIVNVEIKSNSDEPNGIEAVVTQCIQRHQMERRVIISSFNPIVLQRFRQSSPDIPIGYLYAPDFEYRPDLMTPAAHELRHPHHTMIDAAYMQWATEQGYFVNTWTVNEPEVVEQLAKLGVHGVITDKPDMARAVINAIKSMPPSNGVDI